MNYLIQEIFNELLEKAANGTEIYQSTDITRIAMIYQNLGQSENVVNFWRMHIN